LWNLVQRDTEGFSLAMPVAKLDPTAHHIVVGQRLAVVLATADRNRNFAGNRAKPYLAAAMVILGSWDTHRCFAVGDSHAYRQREHSRITSCLRNRFFDRRFVATEHMHDAIDHNLRSIDLTISARFGIGALPIGMTMQRERVFPTKVIP